MQSKEKKTIFIKNEETVIVAIYNDVYQGNIYNSPVNPRLCRGDWQSRSSRPRRASGLYFCGNSFYGCVSDVLG